MPFMDFLFLPFVFLLLNWGLSCYLARYKLVSLPGRFHWFVLPWFNDSLHISIASFAMIFHEFIPFFIALFEDRTGIGFLITYTLPVSLLLFGFFGVFFSSTIAFLCWAWFAIFPVSISFFLFSPYIYSLTDPLFATWGICVGVTGFCLSCQNLGVLNLGVLKVGATIDTDVTGHNHNPDAFLHQ